MGLWPVDRGFEPGSGPMGPDPDLYKLMPLYSWAVSGENTAPDNRAFRPIQANSSTVLDRMQH